MMQKYLFTLILLGVTVTSTINCSIEKIVVRQAAGFLRDGLKIFMAETDLDLAEASLSANIKLLEIMLAKDPENPELLAFLAQSYGGYTVAFVEDKGEALKFTDDAASALQYKRAKAFYLRGFEFARRGIISETGKDPYKLNQNDFKKWISEQDADLVPLIFWASMNYGSAMNADRDDMEMFANVQQVVQGFLFVHKTKPEYFNGGPDLALGAYYGELPSMYGDNKANSLKYFDALEKRFDGKHLLGKVMAAKSVAVQYEDEKLFDKLLKEVMEADLATWPEQGLMNSLAKRKAARLIANKKSYF